MVEKLQGAKAALYCAGSPATMFESLLPYSVLQVTSLTKQRFRSSPSDWGQERTDKLSRFCARKAASK